MLPEFTTAALIVEEDEPMVVADTPSKRCCSSVLWSVATPSGPLWLLLRLLFVSFCINLIAATTDDFLSILRGRDEDEYEEEEEDEDEEEEEEEEDENCLEFFRLFLRGRYL